MRSPAVRRAWAVVAIGVALAAGLVVAAVGGGGTARAQVSVTSATTPDSGTSTTTGVSTSRVQHLYFRYGPLDIRPGQNVIDTNKYLIPQPKEDGWIVGFKPNLELPNGKVPPVDVIHLHHGVWANAFRRDATAPLFPERFFAAGEEKTALAFPRGYGYRYRTSDAWFLNYMIHDLTPKPYTVYLTYDVDFVPATSSRASEMKDVHPIWLDVQNGKVYPVFDAVKGSGADGTFTYPDDDPSAPRKNTYTIPSDGVLIETFGHLHPGGLYDTFSLTRSGQTAKVFTSKAHYYEPAGAVSWDVSMTATPDDWAVAVKAGDQLSITTTYDTSRASWYESMGIGVVWMYDGPGGKDPFTSRIDEAGKLTHGHLPENDNHGGAKTALADPRKTAAGPLATNIPIGSFEYGAGDLAALGKIPTVTEGQSITFDNLDATDQQVWHSITACKAPCTASTGVAYPLADASVQFDSGQLGTGGPPTAGRDTWSTPADLGPGTYTYFCRIHPFMRGAFRVVAPASSAPG
jgi:plastocyanin